MRRKITIFLAFLSVLIIAISSMVAAQSTQINSLATKQGYHPTMYTALISNYLDNDYIQVTTKRLIVGNDIANNNFEIKLLNDGNAEMGGTGSTLTITDTVLVSELRPRSGNFVIRLN